jgi:DNA-binding Lrp family transcriptional regulator
MVRAFMMVTTEAGSSADLQRQIQNIGAVVEANVVAGQYDIIVEVEGESVNSAIHAVATDLRDLGGVTDTRTYICLD